jgi:hypothetical protein
MSKKILITSPTGTQTIISLPMHPYLHKSDIEFIADIARKKE